VNVETGRLGRARYNYWLLLLVAGCCLLATVILGLLAGFVTAMPGASTAWLTMRGLQPLHTGMALAWLLLGSVAVLGLFTAVEDKATLGASRAHVALGLLFVAGLVGSVARGAFSGREYITWPWPTTLPLLAALLLSLGLAARRARHLTAHSSEAAWFILLGLVLLPAALAEAHLYHGPAVGAAIGRDLTVQWHALDTFIAGWSLVLYGIGILILPAGSKPMRGGWLFALAAIGILMDFGHHNYPSPQERLIKIVSFSATMLASVSFVRHVRSLARRDGLADDVRFGLRHVEYWTLFAVGSGIAMAVPWVNLYVHGSYFVVAHTMGAIIGVNSLILYVAAGALSGAAAPGRRDRIRWNSAALALFCVVLMGLGIAKGVLRVDLDPLQTYYRLKPFYGLISAAGIPLVLSMLCLVADLARDCMRMLASLPADGVEIAGALPAAEPRAGAPDAVSS
jgi:nitric oxide reductase subunit B